MAKKKGKKNGGKAGERIELLDDIGDLTPQFKRCLIELFSRFDVDGDKLLSEDELRAFSRAANEDGRVFDETELDEVKEHFDWVEVPGGVDGLSLRGWMQLYQTQTGGEEEETWRDLRRLGYNADLEQCAGGCRTEHAGLQRQLEAWVALGESRDVEAFVAAFVPADVSLEEREAYRAKLRRDDCGELARVVEQLRCCVSGEGVYEIEGDKPSDHDGTVVFNFHLPSAPAIDDSVAFLQEDGEWRTDACFTQMPEIACENDRLDRLEKMKHTTTFWAQSQAEQDRICEEFK